MAISVNHATRVISIPKADLALIQSVPTEIRELDLGQFKLWMRDWEDGEDGITMPPVLNHNSEVTVGGLTLARVVEIINGYTVTFENGAYAVNLTNANSNVGDVVNVNNVSVRANNSAGLVNIRAMEFPAYQSGIVIDTANGVAGALYPTGTMARPSNNMADALTIAGVRGVNTFIVKGNLTLDTGDNVSGYILKGENPITTFITVNTGAVVADTQFEDCMMFGSVLDGYAYVKHVYVSGVTGIEGFLEGCVLADTIQLTPSGAAHTFFVDCKSACVGLGSTDLPKIDMAGTSRHVAFRNFSGPVKIINSTDAANTVCLDVGSGSTITLDASCTAGTVTVRGIANVINNSAMTVISTAQIDQTSIGAAVAQRTLDGSLTVEQSQRVMLAALAGKRSGLGTATETYYGQNGTTPRITLTPADAAGNGTPSINGTA